MKKGQHCHIAVQYKPEYNTHFIFERKMPKFLIANKMRTSETIFEVAFFFFFETKDNCRNN